MMLSLDDAALMRLLDDDCALGDLTTDSLGIGNRPGCFEFTARHPMCVCGVEEAVRLCQLAGLKASGKVPSGASLAPGQTILEGEGCAQDLHRAWKAAQVLIEWASGIATATAEIVATASGVPVACTRKNVPGTKPMSIKAVKAGGATMHRLGLAETLLIFAEHRLFLETSPAQTIARLRRREPEKKIVVEVTTIEEAQCWAAAGADVLQLEKFAPETVARCRLAIIDRTPLPMIAAAGGIHAHNAAAYVAAGADLLITSAPFSAPPRDVAVRFSPCP
jgi:molybdenum transport protein